MSWNGAVWRMGLAVALSLCGSCGYRTALQERAEWPVTIKRSDYPVLPRGDLGDSMRAKAARSPEYKAKYFWGRYGGPGNVAGPPLDAMDELFYQHDVAYLDGVRLWHLRRADWRLIRDLKRLDIDSLGPGARKFQRRAIIYFRLPISWWFGKPKSVFYRCKREPDVIWIGETAK